ncbi:sulfite exporter TauE/SafE family protein [Wolffia australiana]
MGAEMKSKRFVGYLLTAFSAAILSVFFIPRGSGNGSSSGLLHGLSSGYLRVWPELELNWRSVLAAVIGFLGSGFGTVGGVGGGGIFVPVLTLIVGFDAKSAAALSKCMIMGASASSVWYNIRVAHPTKDVPIIDYDLALLFQPMLLLGITLGVSLSVVFPYWLITILIIILFLGTSSRSFCKGIQMWEQETVFNRDEAKFRQDVLPKSSGGEAYTPLLPKKERSAMEIIRSNLRWKGIAVLLLLWVCFLLLQVTKTNAAICSPLFWFINALQFPVAISVFAWEAVKLYRESKARRMVGNFEFVSEASIEWTAPQLLFCAFCGLLGGTVGGLLGSGGGFILGPLLLEIGVIPQVASATATFVMLFSSSLSVVEFYFLGRFPIPYAVYLTSVSLMAGFWGQFFVRRLVLVLKRASIIVFILSSVIFTSALIMGIVGVESSIRMIKNHEYMGFLGFCTE